MINKKFALLFLISMFFYGTTVSMAQALPPSETTMNEFPDLIYPTVGKAFKLPDIWNYQDEDKEEYSSETYDDSKWEKIKIGEPKPSSGWRWYRVAFDLPTELEQQNLLFDLGRVSAYDEVFINGTKVGNWGTPPPRLLHGASHVWRKYPISAEYFRPGRNVLAVRVFVGYRGGLYEGPYTLQALSGNAVIGRVNLKTGGADALEVLLTDTPFLNRFSPQDPLLVGPDIVQLFGEPQHGQLAVKVVEKSGHLVEEKMVNISLNASEWSRSLFRLSMPQELGDYLCRLTFTVEGKTVWDKELPFQVQSQNTNQFQPKVDLSLDRFSDRVLPVQVSSAAMGHFGPREVNSDFQLFDDLEKTDARSGMAYSIQTLKQLGAPRIFLANTRPVPAGASRTGRIHRAAGYVYDGMNDAWVYGSVLPNRAGKLEKLEVKSTSWAKRTYRYEYQSKDWMEFSISTISPAWTVRSNAQKIRVFDQIKKLGIGLPTHLAYESKGQVKVVEAAKGVRGSDMSANWVLAWFNGGENWEEFDTPYLFVLESRPEKIDVYADTALFFSYPKTAGTIQGMPLYGVTLQRLRQTANWKTTLPAEVLGRCRYWSKVLVNAPDEVKRTAHIDEEKDQLTVKDEFTYLNIPDDWQTEGLKIAPVSPVLTLAAVSGNIDIAINKTAKDLQMATLQGPLLALEATDTVLFRVNGLLHYLREVRTVQPSNDVPAHKVQAELNQIVETGLARELRHHPWKETVSDGSLLPGSLRMTYTNLLLTLPYLRPDLREQVEAEIQKETEKYFLYGGVLEDQLKEKLKPEYQDKPVIPVVTNPVSGLKIGTSQMALTRFGIDQTYFSSLNIYMVWRYADTFNRYPWIEENYPVLKNYFNTVRNSHDWMICEAWDTFSGYRVGNGLQEGGGIYAGMVGMARIAKELRDQSTFGQAAYYSVMQAVGMQGQLAASDYLKRYRPWLLSNSKGEDIEYVQKIRSHYFAEFNEFAGLSQAIIGTRNSASSPGGYIESPLPEVMRLYQEVWPEFTNDFYDPKYDKIIGSDRRVDNRISLDAFVYQVTEYPQSVQEVFDVRKSLDIDWWKKLPDYRAYLDSRGKIRYRKLW